MSDIEGKRSLGRIEELARTLDTLVSAVHGLCRAWEKDDDAGGTEGVLAVSRAVQSLLPKKTYPDVFLTMAMRRAARMREIHAVAGEFDWFVVALHQASHVVEKESRRNGRFSDEEAG